MRQRDSQRMTMRCPRCYSLNVRRSARRIWERVLTLFHPMLPYRCRSCQGRFWRRSGSLFNLPRVVAFGGAIALMAVFAIRTLGYLQPSSELIETVPPKTVPPKTLATEVAVPPEVEEKTPSFEPPRVDSDPSVIDGARKSPQEPMTVESDNPEVEIAQPILEVVDSPVSWVLRGIRGEGQGGRLQLVVVAGRPIEDFQSFTLEEPRRIVLDLPGNWTVRCPKVIDLEHHLASRIRIGDHRDKLRLVIDAAMDTARQPRIESSPEGLTVRISPASLRPLPQ